MKYSTVAILAMISILASDVIYRFAFFSGVSNGSTLAVLLLNLLAVGAIVVLLSRKTWRENLPRPARIVWVALLLWNGVTLLHGGFYAQDYWAWKSLITTHLFMFLVPLAAVIGLDLRVFRRIPAAIIWLIFPLGLLFLPLSLTFDDELFSRIVVPVFLLVLSLPFLRRRYWPFVLGIAAVSVLIDPGYRANLTRILFAVVVVLLCFSRYGLRTRILNAAAVAIFVTPLLFLCLGLMGKFNIFREGISVDSVVTAVEGGRVRASELSADTRTFLYREVLTSMEARGSSFVAGQGAGTGYESKFFASSIVGAGGRSGSEVGFLNTLLYSGVIGVLLYAAVILTAAFYAFNRSRNDLAKMIGVFLLLKWVLFFVEDIPKLDLNFFFTWVLVGLCFSIEFRGLDNREVREWFSGGRKVQKRMPQGINSSLPV